MRVLVTRPEPDGLKLKGMIEARGHEAVVEPLLRVSFEDCDPIDVEGVTALIATSRNGLRALSGTMALPQARALTVYAVGAATADEARRMGFGRIVKGPGTADALIPIITSTLDPTEEVLLHLAGEKLAIDIGAELEQQGFRVNKAAVYRMIAADRLSDSIRDQLSDGDIEAVLLMSPQTAQIYSRLIKRHKLEEAVQEIVHLCLSESVARQLKSLGDVPIDRPDDPTLQEMLALVDLTAARMDL